MRKTILLWLMLAAFCGAALYHTSQRVHDGRSELRAMTQEISREEESIRVLNAEWAYLNQPERLEKMASEHFRSLAPLKGRQYAAADSISATPPAPEVAVKAAPLPKREVPHSETARAFSDVLQDVR